MLDGMREIWISARERVSGAVPAGGWLRGIGGVLGFYLVVTLILGMYWSLSPARFDVEANTQAFAEEHGSRVVTGSATTATLIGVAETLLD